MKVNYLLLFARICIASMFVISASMKIFTFETQLTLYQSFNEYTSYAIILSILVEIVLSIMLVAEYKIKFVIIFLIFFLLGNTIMASSKFDEDIIYIIYKKNLAIFGGLIALFSHYVKK